MKVELITIEDFERFKSELIELIREELEKVNSTKQKQPLANDWIKSYQVQKMLKISPGPLQNLRANGSIPYTKMGGILFYKKEDIEALLESNMRNINYTGPSRFL